MRYHWYHYSQTQVIKYSNIFLPKWRYCCMSYVIAIWQNSTDYRIKIVHKNADMSAMDSECSVFLLYSNIKDTTNFTRYSCVPASSFTTCADTNGNLGCWGFPLQHFPPLHSLVTFDNFIVWQHAFMFMMGTDFNIVYCTLAILSTFKFENLT